MRTKAEARPGEWVQTWRSTGEACESEVRAEFAHAFSFPEASRREVLRVMAASLAVAAASACGDASAPSGEAIPYVNRPEQQIPGRPRFYATAMLFEGWAQPVLVETHEGRPTKIEGNPDHPIGNGGTDAFMQAAVLQFYDPDRSQTVRRWGQISTWGSFEGTLPELRQRWAETGGAGLRLLTGGITSPTLNRQLDALLARWPNARWHGSEPADCGTREEALRLALGEPAALHYALDRAGFVVSFEDDLLGPGPQQLRNAGGWAARRRAALGGDGGSTLLVAEPTPTLTGSKAQSRLVVASSRIPALIAALAERIGLDGSGAPELATGERAWLDAAAQGLQAHRGECLLAVGPYQPPEVQALGLSLNGALGAWGQTVYCTGPIARPVNPGNTLAALAADIADGSVETLVVIDANPVYTAPADVDFAALMRRVPLRLHAGLFYDETAEQCQWHLPLSHPLESWSDARAVDGTATIIQPTVRPVYDTRGVHQLLALLLGEPAPDARPIVAQTWRDMRRDAGGTIAEDEWRHILRTGFAAASAPPISARVPRPVAPTGADTATRNTNGNGVEVIFRPDPSVWDGRFANCAWLQELPKPLTKLTWDNVAAVSPALARDLGIDNGDEVALAAGVHRVVAPAWILPGQAERTVTLYLGYGRRRAGAIGDGVGYDAYRLRPTASPWRLGGVQLAAVGSRVALATTQTHGTMEGHDIVRTVTLRQARQAEPDRTDERLPSLHPPWPESEYAWAMAIDLDLCIGCNACVVACQAENNVPSVGREQVALGREMHWLRVDRYYAGPVDDPTTHFMPVPCMHCEKAPCEVGCPVNATVRGNGGINEMVYNRCIGTRTCSSYCPYKVRRFNWFDFTADAAPSIQAQRNPNVTVRARGVMEKCTYCIQRITAARIEAHVDNRRIEDGQVATACQAACPTTAIMFGDAGDANSRVSRWRRSPRHYALLENLGTRPRTTYLAEVNSSDREEES